MRRVLSGVTVLVLATSVAVAQAPAPITTNNVDYDKGYPKAVAGRIFECKGSHTEDPGPPAWTCDYVAFTGKQTVKRRGVPITLTTQEAAETKPIPSPFDLQVTFSTTDPAEVTLSAGWSRIVTMDGGTFKESESKFRGPAAVTPLP